MDTLDNNSFQNNIYFKRLTRITMPIEALTCLDRLCYLMVHETIYTSLKIHVPIGNDDEDIRLYQKFQI